MKNNIIIFLLVFLPIVCNAQTVYLYTPKGSQVYAVQKSEMSAADITYYTNLYADTYPNATVLANASATYNCHSYAWNMVEGGSICWLNQDPDLHKYWDDGSYIQTTEANATKIFYYNGDHSAVKSTTHSGMYESKWGSMPLMRHAPTYCPSIYNATYRRYYVKNCPVVNFTNQTVTTNRTVTSSCDINVQNVTVANNAKLKLHTPGEVTINGPFEVALGSELEIK